MTTGREFEEDINKVPQPFRKALIASSITLNISDSLIGRKLTIPQGAPIAIFDEFSRATKTYRAVLLLASRGYGQQAESLARGLFESFLVSDWAFRNPTLADEYVTLHAGYGMELNRQAMQSTGLWPGANRAPLLEKAEIERAKMLFGKGGNWYWTGHRSLEELAKDAMRSSSDEHFSSMIRVAYQVIIGYANKLTHATGISNISHRAEIAFDSQTATVDVGPSDRNVMNSLISAGNSYLWTLKVFAKAFEPSLSPDLKNCSAFMWRSQHEERKLLSLQDDDLCPCDIPRTKWGDCHKETNGAADRLHQAGFLKADDSS